MFINTSGNVGIGTTSPGAKLSVEGGDIKLNHNNAAANYYLRLNKKEGQDGGILLSRDNTFDWQIVNAATSGDLWAYAYGAGTVAMAIKRSNAYVGIGTTSPVSNLEISGAAPFITITDTTETDCGILFRDLQANYGQAAAIKFSSADNKLRFCNNDADAIKMTIGTDGYVGIANDNPGYLLDVNGTIRATGDVLAYSDARVKENVETIDNALDKVMSMRGVSYNRTDNDDKTKKVGVIAQEIQKVLPEVVSEQEDGMLSVSYGNIVGVLIEAIKEQQKQIDELKSLLNGSTK